MSVNEYIVVANEADGAPLFCKISYSVADSDKIASINRERIYTNYLRDISCSFFADEALTQADGRNFISYTWRIGTPNSLVQRTSLRINELELPPVLFNEDDNQQITLTLKVKDENGTIFIFSGAIDYYRLRLLSPNSFNVVPQNENISTSLQYISNIVKFNVSVNQQPKDPQYTLLFYKGVGEVNQNNEKYWKFEDSYLKAYQAVGDYHTYENCISGIIDDKEYRFKVVLAVSLPSKNIVLGQKIDTRIYRLLNAPNVASFAFSKAEWHPIQSYVDNVILSNGSREDEIVVFSSTCFDDPGGRGINYYKIEAILNNNRIILESKIGVANHCHGWQVEVSGNTIYFKIKNLNLFEKLNLASNTENLSIKYEITCYNAYGRAGKTLTYNGTIITQEKPIVKDLNLTYCVNSAAKEKYLNWVNPGDQITFTIDTLPLDYNDYLLVSGTGEKARFQQTILEYEICYRYQSSNTWQSLQRNVFDYSSNFFDKKLLSNESEQLLDSLENYLSYEFFERTPGMSLITIPLPNLNRDLNGTEVEFGIRFIDDSGLASEFLTQKLIVCRKVKPIFNINHATATTIAQKDELGNEIEKKQITVYLQSIDLGGNNRGAENFQRSGRETYEIIFEYDYENNNFDRSISYLEQSSNLKISEETQTFSQSKIFELSEDWNRIYIKATIKIYPNSETDDEVQTTTSIYLLYLNEPTMSHRAHWIGINTTQNNQEDVFHVSQINDKNIDKKYVRLSGFSQGGPRDILIDLSTGILMGYYNEKPIMEINLIDGIIKKATIDCGTW